MSKLRTLKEKRAIKFEKMEELHNRSNVESRDLSKKEQSDWDTLEAELRDLDKSIEREQTFSQRQAEMAATQGTSLTTDNGSPAQDKNLDGWLPSHRNVKVLTDDADKHLESREANGATVGMYLRSLVNGPANEVEARALSGLTSGTAKNLVPDPISRQIIDLLRANTVLTQAGANFIELDTNNYAIAKQLTDVPAAWRNELETIAIGDPTFGRVELDVKNLGGAVKVSRELLADNVIGLDRQLSDSFARKFALEFEDAVLFGDGAKQPTGITEYAGAHSITKSGDPITGYSDLLLAWTHLLGGDVTPTATIANPREMVTYASLTATDGQPLVAPKLLEAIPLLPTTAVPIDGGGSNDHGTMIIGDFRQLVVAIRQNIEVRVLDQTYAATNEVAFMATMRGDSAPMRENAFCVIEGIGQ